MAERLSTGFVNAVNATGSVKAIMADGVIGLYSGTQPATADAVEIGDLLMLITVDAGAFEAGTATNGLEMGTSADGVLSKASGETWKGVGLAAAGASPGTQAGWYRWYDNDYVTGASTTAIRVDGAVGTTASYEMFLTNNVIITGGELILQTFNYNFTKS